MLNDEAPAFARNGRKLKLAAGAAAKKENARAVPFDRGPQGTLAAEIAKMQRDRLRYCWKRKAWFAFDGQRWREHGDDVANAAMRELAMHYYGLAAEERNDAERKRLGKLAEMADAAKGRKDVLELTRAEPGMSIELDAFDRDPWLLNVANGTIELQTGTFREHRAIDYQLKQSPVEYDRNATAPTWSKFLGEIMAEDADLIAYLQRLVGYCATGVIREHVLPILWGGGRNGKGTFIALIDYVLGEYAVPLPDGMLLAQKFHRHPAELMTLYGARFAVSQEINRGGELNAARVKSLTGGDRISARGMRQNFRALDPTHKIVLVANHRPVVREQTNAMWQRINLVPFTVTFANPDEKLREKLLTEASGILNWIIDGCLAWQREGLNPPAKVGVATEEYRAASDLIGQFIADCCRTDRALTCSKTELLLAFNQWATREGHDEMKVGELHDAMLERGFSEGRTGKRGRFWKGIAMQIENDDWQQG